MDRRGEYLCCINFTRSLCFLSSYWFGVVNGPGFFRYMEGLFVLFFFLGAAFGVDSFAG